MKVRQRGRAVLESLSRWLLVGIYRLERAIQRFRRERDMYIVVDAQPVDDDAHLEGRYPWHER